MATKVKLRTSDVSVHLIPNSLSYGPLDIGNRISTARFALRKATAPFLPDESDYVEITQPDGVTLAFAGKVRQPQRDDPLGGDERIPVAASDWNADLDRIVITSTEMYAAGKSDRAIVEDLLTKYYGPIATSLTHMVFARRHDMPVMTFTAGQKTLRQAFDAIALEAFGATYYAAPDKSFHWNDVNRAAPFALSDVPSGTLLRAYRNLNRFLDASREVHRVKVIGTGAGVEYLATDWVGWVRCNRRLADQPGAPGFCYSQIPDITDTALTTIAQCQQRAFAELEANREREIFRLETFDAGLLPGQRLPIYSTKFDEAIPHLRSMRSPVFWSDRKQQPKGRGNLLIQRVTPAPLPKDQWRFVLECGSYEPGLEEALVKV